LVANLHGVKLVSACLLVLDEEELAHALGVKGDLFGVVVGEHLAKMQTQG
jgi:hypothetical protein